MITLAVLIGLAAGTYSSLMMGWLDNPIYYLFYWRWSHKFSADPVLRELFISYLKSFDTLDQGTKIKITIERKE